MVTIKPGRHHCPPGFFVSGAQGLLDRRRAGTLRRGDVVNAIGGPATIAPIGIAGRATVAWLLPGIPRWHEDTADRWITIHPHAADAAGAEAEGQAQGGDGVGAAQSHTPRRYASARASGDAAERSGVAARKVMPSCSALRCSPCIFGDWPATVRVR